jgi:hypothetical protein
MAASGCTRVAIHLTHPAITMTTPAAAIPEAMGEEVTGAAGMVGEAIKA